MRLRVHFEKDRDRLDDTRARVERMNTFTMRQTDARITELMARSWSASARRSQPEHPDRPALADVRGASGGSSLPTSKDDAGVDAPEAEAVRDRMLYRHAPGLTGHEVDAVRGRVAIFEIESGRRDLVA